MSDQVEKKKRKEPEAAAAAAAAASNEDGDDVQEASASKDMTFKVEGAERWAEIGQAKEFKGEKTQKRITIRKFKGNLLVDIREYYQDKKDSLFKPSKKGVSLSKENWEILVKNKDLITKQINEL